LTAKKGEQGPHTTAGGGRGKKIREKRWDRLTGKEGGNGPERRPSVQGGRGKNVGKKSLIVEI